MLLFLPCKKKKKNPLLTTNFPPYFPPPLGAKLLRIGIYVQGLWCPCTSRFQTSLESSPIREQPHQATKATLDKMTHDLDIAKSSVTSHLPRPLSLLLRTLCSLGLRASPLAVLPPLAAPLHLQDLFTVYPHHSMVTALASPA